MSLISRPRELTPMHAPRGSGPRIALLAALALQGCGGADRTPSGALGTPELRAALFDSILVWTADREAFSPPKNAALGFDPLEAMAALRNDVVEAATEEDLYYALLRLSNARRDRHLSVALVPGGLTLPHESGLPAWDRDEPPDPPTAPVRILPDYGESGSAYFIADVARGIDFPEGAPGLGDRVTRVNGIPVSEFEALALPYVRHSSMIGFRWKLAEALPRNTALFPPHLRGERLELALEAPGGATLTVSLPYLDEDSLDWTGWAEPAYPGFTRQWESPTYDLYLPDDGRRVILLRWHGFEPSLVADVDRLLDFAGKEELLDRAVLFDATRSGGGSLGPYAVQHLQPRPFRTTFGTLQISDVIEPFVRERREAFRNRRVYDGEGPETVDDGSWLLDWLENEVLDDLAQGREVTDPVPFKLAHAPKDSDGLLQPAPVHFRGPLVVFSGPSGGSHLDQFISIVGDNKLGPILGMPPGGYSNTWEWEQVLTFPGTGQPVVGFMWNIGHTLRPNGEILEGNPAAVTHPLPLTAANAGAYYDLLLEEAYAYLYSVGFEVGG
jgi:hypothetical protein